MNGGEFVTIAYVDPVRWGGEFWVWERRIGIAERGEFIDSAPTLKAAQSIADARNARGMEG